MNGCELQKEMLRRRWKIFFRAVVAQDSGLRREQFFDAALVQCL